MKQLIAATVLIGISNLAIATDSPQLRHRFTEYARVIDVKPVYHRVSYEKPHKECWIEQQEHVVVREGQRNRFGNRGRINSSRSNSGGNALVGGIIGGVIGNQIGRKGSRSTRTGATVAGAIVGSVIANEARGNYDSRYKKDYRHNNRPQRVVTTRPVEHCRETVRTAYRERIKAYDVSYEYRGRVFTTRTNRDPGREIELQVNVAPARQ